MLQDFQSNVKFNTHEMLVLIEDIAHSESAFGVNESGDIIFFNRRLVEKMKLEIGDEVYANCIPNFEDKRDDVKWRCLFVK